MKYALFNQYYNVEAIVVQKLNQGTIPKKGCNPRPTGSSGRVFRGSFFGYFFGQAKSNKQECLNHDL